MAAIIFAGAPAAPAKTALAGKDIIFYGKKYVSFKFMSS